MTGASAPSARMPVGPYWYENLGEDEFQKLCDVLIASKFDGVTCYPVGQKDGGRDIVRRSGTGAVVYQVKWSKDAVKNPLTWLENTINDESPGIEGRVTDGATRYVLMTSVAGTAAVATGPHGFGAGTIDKLEGKLREYAVQFGLESMECWWRDDIDALVSTLPLSAMWRFSRMLAGVEAMRFLLHADQRELSTDKLALLVRKAVSAQWTQDAKIKFKQVELDDDDLTDLFVDVKVQLTVPAGGAPPGRPTPAATPARSVGAVAHLLASQWPFTLVRGEPGQGKSTLGQYLCQVYRSEFIPDNPDLSVKRPSPTASLARTPLRVELRDYGTWLDGTNPFDNSATPPHRAPKPRGQQAGSVERFLAALLADLAAVDRVDAATVDDLLDRFPMLVVFDGLDEVAQPLTRQRVVTEIEKFIGRWRAARSVPAKIVVTTRPNVSDLPEPSTRWFEIVTLTKLDRELRTAYVRKWCAARGIVSADKRNLMRSFDTRTAEPHIAQLAENPMQLTILLYLLHLQGHSVPDKRTPLYDDYMKTFLNREAEKSASVRANRRTLEEVTAYLGWYLQGRAEGHGGDGRLTITNLKTEIYRYLAQAQKPTSLVDALFTDVTDRVWALTSKVEGTFEFDVQPVREFFAAKFLYEYANAHKSDILNALIRRPFWSNTSRFFAGFANPNEIGGLVDGLTEELAGGRHPMAERDATWTLLADGVFSSKTTAQRRAVELLTEDLSVRLLWHAPSGAELLPDLPADRGATILRERLLDATAADPTGALSPERLLLAASLDHYPSVGQWWLDRAHRAFGTTSEQAWLRLGATLGVSQLLEPTALETPSLTAPTAAADAVAAGIKVPEDSPQRRKLLAAALAGNCSDVLAPGTDLIGDLVNALAPREFLHMAQAIEATDPSRTSPHPNRRMPILARREAFLRLKTLDPRFGKIQQVMNSARTSTNTVAPWSNSAEVLRDIYGPCWLATDIAVIGAAIDPEARRDVGPMNPSRAPFGPDIDYGRLVNDTRRNRNDARWWLDQHSSLPNSDRVPWAYALVAIATPPVVEACLSELAADVDALPETDLVALMASSSRLGLARVSRRLPCELAAAACSISPTTALLLAHHFDLPERLADLTTSFTTAQSARAARFGAAGWPALLVAGQHVADGTDAEVWLEVLAAHGPTAVAPSEPSHQSLNAHVCDLILESPGTYPVQWVGLAEQARSAANVEEPLLTHASSWFAD